MFPLEDLNIVANLLIFNLEYISKVELLTKGNEFLKFLIMQICMF